jgi:hypothetical protein
MPPLVEVPLALMNEQGVMRGGEGRFVVPESPERATVVLNITEESEVLLCGAVRDPAREAEYGRDGQVWVVFYVDM